MELVKVMVELAAAFRASMVILPSFLKVGEVTEVEKTPVEPEN